MPTGNPPMIAPITELAPIGAMVSRKSRRVW